MVQRVIGGGEQRLYRAMGVYRKAMQTECVQLVDEDGRRREPLHNIGQTSAVNGQRLELYTGLWAFWLFVALARDAPGRAIIDLVDRQMFQSGARLKQIQRCGNL